MADDDIHEHFVDFEWKKLVYVPISPGYMSYPVYTESHTIQRCRMIVFVQGNLEEVEQKNKMIFLTVHDIGKNHESFVQFVNSQPMAPIKERSIFLHVCVPGQAADAKDQKHDFPTMEQLGEGLAQVLEKFNLSKCVAIGEGAGADAVCRFAMAYHQLVIGTVLIHCTSTTHGILEHVKEILNNLTLEDGAMTHSTWNYLLTHRFGHHHMDDKQKEFIEHIKNVKHINEHNLSRYIYSFAHRTDFTHELKAALAKVDAILVTGGKSSHNDNVQHMFEHMSKARTSLLIAEDITDVLEESPSYVAAAIILLCQRKGIFSDMELPIVKPDMPISVACAPEQHHHAQCGAAAAGGGVGKPCCTR